MGSLRLTRSARWFVVNLTTICGRSAWGLWWARCNLQFLNSWIVNWIVNWSDDWCKNTRFLENCSRQDFLNSFTKFLFSSEYWFIYWGWRWRERWCTGIIFIYFISLIHSVSVNLSFAICQALRLSFDGSDHKLETVVWTWLVIMVAEEEQDYEMAAYW